MVKHKTIAIKEPDGLYIVVKCDYNGYTLASEPGLRLKDALTKARKIAAKLDIPYFAEIYQLKATVKVRSQLDEMAGWEELR